MARTIYKYPFYKDDFVSTITFNGGDVVPLFVGVDPQTGAPAVWCELDPEGDETVTFHFIGTGHPVPEGTYVGSAIVLGGYVWHVYRM